MNLLVQYESLSEYWNDYEKLKEETYKAAVNRNQFQKAIRDCQDDLFWLQRRLQDLQEKFNAYEELGKGLTARMIELEEGDKND